MNSGQLQLQLQVMFFRPPLFSLENWEVDEGEVHRTFIVECGEGRIAFVKVSGEELFCVKVRLKKALTDNDIDVLGSM